MSAFVLAVTSLALGWYVGYRSLTAYLAFWSLCALVVLTARRLSRQAFGSTGSADAIIRGFVLAFGMIVLAGLTLGTVGLLGTGPYLIFFAACFLAAWRIPSVRSVRLQPDLPGPAKAGHDVPNTVTTAAVIGVLAALLAFFIATGIIQSPFTLYDSLSYHLLFPARWLQEHRLSIIPTPFSDPAQAYQPSNGELFFLWLMMPFHGDLFARIGQLPFLLLAGVALFALARRLGAPPERAIYSPAFFFLGRLIVEQAVGADVDIISSATFVTAVYLGIVAIDRDEPRDWAIWGVAVGLFCGTKYLALIYAPLFLCFPFVRGVRLKSRWALPGVAALGLPWYLRNWIVAGSPIYPATFRLAGITFARGAYSREAMAHSVFHASGLRLWAVVTSHAFGPTLFLFWLPCALLGAGSILLRRRWWPAGLVLLLFAVMLPLEWAGLPVNIDGRFLLPAVALAMVLISFTFGEDLFPSGSPRFRSAWNAGVRAIYLAAMAWILVGVRSQIRAEVPWYMNGWLSLDGLIGRGALPWFAGLALVSAGVWSWSARAPQWRRPMMTGLVASAAIALAVASDTACRPDRCNFLTLSSTFIRPPTLEAWDWVAHNTRNAAFAYTGNNVPYPLFGEQLTNRVNYVNIDRHLDWRLHDYARVRARPGSKPPATPLAVASDELMPAERHGETIDASRPRFERLDGYRDAWISNLRALGIDHLFVSTLSAYEVDYVWHNAAGFPVEDEWARADPSVFALVFENPQVRIYAVQLR